MTREHEVRAKFEVLAPLLNERLTRLWAAAEADVLGMGGIAIVERATGLSRTTIRVGRDELRAGATPEDVQVRRAGGGRTSIEETRPPSRGEMGHVDRFVSARLLTECHRIPNRTTETT